MLKSLFSILLFTTLILIACGDKKAVLPFYNTPDFTPHFINQSQANSQITHHIAPFAFQNQDGKTITEKDVEGKIHVANFIFTRCISICPIMTDHMKLLQDDFGKEKDLLLLSYSVTPWLDTVGRLKEYAAAKEITAPNWHLLTGEQGKIYELARKSYFAEENLGFTKDSTDFLHTEHILLIDREKRIRGIYNGTLRLEIDQLKKDISALLKE
jgi:protein SCO1